MPRSNRDQKFLAEALVDRMIDWPDEALNELMYAMEKIERKYDLIVHLDAETLAAVQEGLAQAERGEFATDEEIEEVFGRYRTSRKRRPRSSN